MNVEEMQNKLRQKVNANSGLSGKTIGTYRFIYGDEECFLSYLYPNGDLECVKDIEDLTRGRNYHKITTKEDQYEDILKQLLVSSEFQYADGRIVDVKTFNFEKGEYEKTTCIIDLYACDYEVLQWLATKEEKEEEEKRIAEMEEEEKTDPGAEYRNFDATPLMDAILMREEIIAEYYIEVPLPLPEDIKNKL